MGQLPHGFFDISGDDAAARLAIADAFRVTAESFGFDRFMPSPVGFESIFTGFGSESGERLFRFPDRKGRALALTSDSLIVAARTAAGRAAAHSQPVHLYGIVPVFRYRRTRYRNWNHLVLSFFHEAEGAVADVMLPRALRAFLGRLDVPFVLDCCDYGILDAVLLARGFEREAARRAVYNVRKGVIAGLAEELVGGLLAEGTPEAALKLAHGDAGVARQLAATAEVMALLSDCGVPAEENWRFDHAAEHHSGFSFVIRARATDGREVDIGDGGGFHAIVNSTFGMLRTAWSAALSLDVMADFGMGGTVVAPVVDMFQLDASASFFFLACDWVRGAGVAVREHPSAGRAARSRVPQSGRQQAASAICRVGGREEESRSVRLILAGRPDAELCFDLDGDRVLDLRERLI